MINRKHLKITLICAIFLLTGATMGCVDECITIIEEDFERAANNPTPAPTHSDSYYRLVEPTPKATPELKPIDIIFNDIVRGDIANKDHYSMVGESKDVHICGNMACEQADWIRDNYGYNTGIVLLWSKYQGIGHAQTWVIIAGERYILESTHNAYWTEDEHRNEFGEVYKINFVSIQKGREHTKESAEICRGG